LDKIIGSNMSLNNFPVALANDVKIRTYLGLAALIISCDKKRTENVFINIFEKQ